MIQAHSSVDWGNVPAWVGSILTGGSLLLGFYILLRDRRGRERQQAEQLGCFFVLVSRGEGPPAVTAHLHNGSGLPIINPVLYGRPKFKAPDGDSVRASVERLPIRPGRDGAIPEDPSSAPEFWQLMPDERVQIDIGLRGEVDQYCITLDYWDARYRQWRIEYPTYRLTRLSKSRFPFRR